MFNGLDCIIRFRRSGFLGAELLYKRLCLAVSLFPTPIFFFFHCKVTTDLKLTIDNITFTLLIAQLTHILNNRHLFYVGHIKFVKNRYKICSFLIPLRIIFNIFNRIKKTF